MDGLWSIVETVVDKANTVLGPFFKLFNSTIFWVIIIGVVVIVVGLACWVGIRVLLLYIINWLVGLQTRTPLTTIL